MSVGDSWVRRLRHRGSARYFRLQTTSFSRLAFSTGSEMTFPQLSSSGGTQEDTPLFNPQRSLATCHHLDGEQFGSDRVLTWLWKWTPFCSFYCCRCFVSFQNSRFSSGQSFLKRGLFWRAGFFRRISCLSSLENHGADGVRLWDFRVDFGYE